MESGVTSAPRVGEQLQERKRLCDVWLHKAVTVEEGDHSEATRESLANGCELAVRRVALAKERVLARAAGHAIVDDSVAMRAAIVAVQPEGELRVLEVACRLAELRQRMTRVHHDQCDARRIHDGDPAARAREQRPVRVVLAVLREAC